MRAAGERVFRGWAKGYEDGVGLVVDVVVVVRKREDVEGVVRNASTCGVFGLVDRLLYHPIYRGGGGTMVGCDIEDWVVLCPRN